MPGPISESAGTRRNPRKRVGKAKPHTFMSNHWGGCFECADGDQMWDAPDVRKIALAHHRKTGHTTWTDITFSTRIGDKGMTLTDNGSLRGDGK